MPPDRMTSPDRGRQSPKPRTRSRQVDVDIFWSAFHTKHPGTVSHILPADALKIWKARDEDKEIGEGIDDPSSYGQAALACKQAVDKIAKQCRRINQKYRDRDFDIEIDLKNWTRDCLDGLDTKADGNSPNTQPKAVKRISVSLQKQ